MSLRPINLFIWPTSSFNQNTILLPNHTLFNQLLIFVSFTIDIIQIYLILFVPQTTIRTPPARPFDLFTCVQQPQHALGQWRPAVMSRPSLSSDRLVMSDPYSSGPHPQESFVTSSQRPTNIHLSTPVKMPINNCTDDYEIFAFNAPKRTSSQHTSSPMSFFDYRTNQQMTAGGNEGEGCGSSNTVNTGGGGGGGHVFADPFQSTAVLNQTKSTQWPVRRMHCNTPTGDSRTYLQSGHQKDPISYRSQWSKKINPAYLSRPEQPTDLPRNECKSMFQSKYVRWSVVPVLGFLFMCFLYSQLYPFAIRPYSNRLLPHSLTSSPAVHHDRVGEDHQSVFSDSILKSSSIKDQIDSSANILPEASTSPSTSFVSTHSGHNSLQKSTYSSSNTWEPNALSSTAIQQPLEQQLQQLRERLQLLDNRQLEYVRNQTHQLYVNVQEKFAIRLQLLQRSFDQRLQRLLVTQIRQNSCNCLSKDSNGFVSESADGGDVQMVTISQVDDRIRSALETQLGEQMQHLERQASYKCDQIVKERLSDYDADKLGEANFASEVAGSKVLASSDTHSGQYTKLYLFGWIPFKTYSQPDWLIQPRPASMYNGWFMVGQSGYVRIQLGQPLLAESFVYEHLPDRLAVRQEHLTCAPKRIRIVGFDGLSTAQSTTGSDQNSFASKFSRWLDSFPRPALGNQYELGNFEFYPPATPDFPIRRFNLSRPVHGKWRRRIAVKFFELHILNNHGNRDYTCLFKLRLTGEPAY